MLIRDRLQGLLDLRTLRERKARQALADHVQHCATLAQRRQHCADAHRQHLETFHALDARQSAALLGCTVSHSQVQRYRECRAEGVNLDLEFQRRMAELSHEEAAAHARLLELRQQRHQLRQRCDALRECAERARRTAAQRAQWHAELDSEEQRGVTAGE